MSNSNEPTDLLSRSNAHPNPMFDFLSGFMPRKLKDLFRWCEYLYYNSTHIYAATQKLADYVITDIVYNTDNTALKKQYRELFTKHLKLKRVLKTAQRDRNVYGNGFYSVYFPVKRMATHKACRTSVSIADTGFKYDSKKMIFQIPCPKCNKSFAVALDDVRDVSIAKPENAKLIRWDPKLIDIDHNHITDQTEYWYNIPGYVRKKVENSDKLFVATMPKSFLKAISKDMMVQFAPGVLYHLKVDAPSGIDPQWGFPSLASTLKKFYYAAVLRKGNEAIAMDHIVPFRVLHPQAASGAGDPVQTISMANWTEQTRKEIKQWRKDPLHIMMSPVPLGVSQMGGQGRALLTLGEVKQVEDDIIAALGLPREFLYGGLTFTGSSVTLRMLENQLMNDTDDLVELGNWIASRCARAFKWDSIKIGLTPFKFIDDVAQKSLEIGANAQYNHLAPSTIAQMFSRDLDDERKKQMEDSLDQLRHDKKLEQRMAELENSLALQAQQAQMESIDRTGMGYDQQAVIGNADSIVEQLMGAEEGQRRSYLASLQAEDYVLYSVVIQRLEEAQLQEKNQAQADAGV